MKKAFIFDLDNTIFPVPSIGDKLFAPLFRIISGTEHVKDIEGIRREVMRTPFQKVAKRFGLSESLTRECVEVLKTLEHHGPIAAFPDFQLMRNIPVEKFLVTTGFTKMQQSKIRALDLHDFKETFVVDPTITDKTKKDVFVEIMEKYHYQPGEVLVIGDDPESEIRAARELGIECVLYDKANSSENGAADLVISGYDQLLKSDLIK